MPFSPESSNTFFSNHLNSYISSGEVSACFLFFSRSLCAPSVYYQLISCRWKWSSGNLRAAKRGGVFPQSLCWCVACQLVHLAFVWRTGINTSTTHDMNSVTQTNEICFHMQDKLLHIDNKSLERKCPCFLVLIFKKSLKDFNWTQGIGPFLVGHLGERP